MYIYIYIYVCIGTRKVIPTPDFRTSPRGREDCETQENEE